MTKLSVPLLCILAASGCAAGSRARDGSVVERAEAALARERGRAGDLALWCEPADAEISVEGTARGRCSDFQGRPLLLGEGMHRVEVKKQGYWPYQTWIEPSGTRASLKVTLSPREESEGAAP